MDAAKVMKCLLDVGAAIPTGEVNDDEVLNTVLAFLRPSRSEFETNGLFERSPSIDYIMNEGSGAIIKKLLLVSQWESLKT